MKTALPKIILLAAVFSTTVIHTQAQEKKTAVPEQLQYLMKFLGRWDAMADLVLNGKKYQVAYHLSGRKTAGGSGVYMDEWFDDKELGSLNGANLAGYNPYDSRIHWFSVDNMGTTHEHTGSWEGPDHLTIVHEGKRDGKAYVEKINFDFKDANTMNFMLMGTLDGNEVEHAEGVFHRKPAPSPGSKK